jgi:hypothetical protein
MSPFYFLYHVIDNMTVLLLICEIFFADVCPA